MMSTRVPLAALAAFAFGCASGGGGNDLPPVRAYASTDELPCEYEVIETVSGWSARSVQGSRTAYERIRADVLGRAGADIGADAVIIPEIDDFQHGGRQLRPLPLPPLLRFSGEAIRFIPGTCDAAE